MLEKCYNTKCEYHEPGGADGCKHPVASIYKCKRAVIRDRLVIEKQRSDYEGIRYSNECRCGRDKKSGYMLCLKCWKRLPWEIQVSLFSGAKNIGNAYEVACTLLEAWDQE